MRVVGLTLRVSSAHRTDPGLARPILGHLSHPDPSTKTPILLPILTGNCRWNQYWVIFHHTQPTFQSLFVGNAHQYQLATNIHFHTQTWKYKAPISFARLLMLVRHVHVQCTNVHDESNDKDSTCLTKNRIPPGDHPDPCWKQQFREQILVGMNESLLLPLLKMRMRMRMRSHLK